MTDQTTGACLCGSVTFTAELPSKWVAHCHCTMCQRAHGTAFVTWVSVEEKRVTVRDLQGVLRWYSSSVRRSAASASAAAAHCFRSAKWPGEPHIARASFTGPVDRRPQVHAYFDAHVDWFVVNDGLPKRAG